MTDIPIGDTLVVDFQPVLDAYKVAIPLLPGTTILASLVDLARTIAPVLASQAIVVSADAGTARAMWVPAVSLAFVAGTVYEIDAIAVLPDGEVMKIGKAKVKASTRITTNP